MRKLIFFIILVIFLLSSLFPIYWMIITSFKPNADLYSYKSPLILQNISFENYRKLFFDSTFVIWFYNSIIVSLLSTTISIIVSTFCSYSISRIKFSGSKGLSYLFLIFYLIPTSILFLPVHKYFSQFGLSNSILVLSLIYSSFLIPFSIWFLLSFFNSIPPQYERASFLDGCNYFQSLLKIVLPLARKGIIITSIFCFILSWNEYIYALVFLNNPRLKTLTIGLASLETGDVFEWGSIMAAGTITSIPVIVAFLFIQRYFISGFSLGLINTQGKD